MSLYIGQLVALNTSADQAAGVRNYGQAPAVVFRISEDGESADVIALTPTGTEVHAFVRVGTGDGQISAIEAPAAPAPTTVANAVDGKPVTPQTNTLTFGESNPS